MSHQMHKHVKILRVGSPAGMLKGRAISVRMVKGLFDIAAMAMYFPPRGSLPREQSEKLVSKLCEWLHDTLCLLPARTVQLLYFDLNDDVSEQRSDEGSAVGAYPGKKQGHARFEVRKFWSSISCVLSTRILIQVPLSLVQVTIHV